MKMEDHKLKLFMKNNFDFAGLKKAGFFKGISKSDYKAQADRVCHFFGYESIYEYGSTISRCHVSYPESERDKHSFVETFGRDLNIVKAEINLMYPNNTN